MNRRVHHSLLLLLILLLTGCSGLQRFPEPMNASQACLQLFERSDAQIRKAQAGDGGAARISGFPWLRTDRLLASFRDQIEGPEQYRHWVARLSELDRQARGFELQNMGPSRRQHLQQQWQPVAEQWQLPETLDEALHHCRDRLNAGIWEEAAARDTLRVAAVAPDAYNSWQRALGLYSLARRIARPRVVALHEELQAQFDAGIPDIARMRYYAVPREHDDRAPATTAALIRRLDRDALGIPRLDPATRQHLFQNHAPLWAVDSRSHADQPGALTLDASGQPLVDTRHATEYRWLSLTRFGGEVLLQLNYLVWFPERPPQTRCDMVAGELDGMIWRTTLDRDGRVLAHDSIHPCGCYYALFPAEGWQVAPQPDHREPVFVPRNAPVAKSGERLVLQLASGTRYFIDVSVTDPVAATQALASLPADTLRSMPVPDAGRASVYEPNGLVAASRRPERFVFWPLGVSSAGTMRQPGTHAISFIGRRHFDDAYLLEKLLIRSTPAQD